MNVCIDSPRVVGNGKKVNALPRRARLARARRGPRARERRARESDEGDANDGVVFDDERCARGVRASGAMSRAGNRAGRSRGGARATRALGRGRAGTRGRAIVVAYASKGAVVRASEKTNVLVVGRGGREHAVVLEVGIERVHRRCIARRGTPGSPRSEAWRR